VRARETGCDAYDLLIAQAAQEPTALLLLPHFTSTGTPHFDTQSKGVLAGLRLSTTKGEIIRAVLEGITYEMALNVQVLRECGASISAFRATGGGAKSPFWMQLKADLLGKPVSAMRVSEAVCLGVAILAGTATGVYANAREAALRISRVERTYRPNSKRSRFYSERFQLYRELYPTLREWLHRL
jgi:xylulokinase